MDDAQAAMVASAVPGTFNRSFPGSTRPIDDRLE